VSTHLSHSVRYAEEALALARADDDRRSEAAALRALGWTHALEDDYDTAVTLGREGLAISRELGDLWETSWSLERLAQSAYTRPEQVIEWFEESLSGFREVGDNRRAGMVLYKMAEAGVRAGLPLDTTEQWVNDSLAILEQMGSAHDIAHALLELGKIKRRQGHPLRAREVLESGLEQMQMIGDQRCTTRTMVALGITLIQVDDPLGAWQHLRSSLEMASTVGEKQVVRVALAGMGQICAADGSNREAATLTAAAERLNSDLRVAPNERALARREKRADAMRAALGKADFDMLWRTGHGFTLDEAVDFALGLPLPSK
jgi:tetratricopeptide (TPR) repeat protein